MRERAERIKEKVMERKAGGWREAGLRRSLWRPHQNGEGESYEKEALARYGLSWAKKRQHLKEYFCIYALPD